MGRRVYFGIRSEQAALCALVVIGVNERGEKKLLAIEDGYRESVQSWREVLLHLKHRGLGDRAPKLAVGDGALGFWGAPGGGLSGYPRAALLGAQDGQRPESAAEGRPAESQA